MLKKSGLIDHLKEIESDYRLNAQKANYEKDSYTHGYYNGKYMMACCIIDFCKYDTWIIKDIH